MDNFTAWLDDGEAQQAKRAAHEDPAFKSEEVSSWLMRLQKVRRCRLVGPGGGQLGHAEAWSCWLECSSGCGVRPCVADNRSFRPQLQEFTRLNSKKKPRPPPPPPPSVDANTTDANATDAEGAKAGGDGPEGEQQAEGEQEGQGDGKQKEQQEKQEEQPAAEEDEDKLDHDELR